MVRPLAWTMTSPGAKSSTYVREPVREALAAARSKVAEIDRRCFGPRERRLLTGRSHLRRAGLGGRDLVARAGSPRSRPHHDLALVLEHRLAALVHAEGLHLDDAGLAAAAVVTVDDPGHRSDRVARDDRAQELGAVVPEVRDGLLRVVLHAEREDDVEDHLRARDEGREAVGLRRLGAEIDGRALHERAREVVHRRGVERERARMLEHLSGHEGLEVAAVLGRAHRGAVEVKGRGGGELPLRRGDELHRDLSLLSARSTSARVTTLRASVSSAPSKMERTRESTK